MLSYILEELSDDSTEKRIHSRLGYSIGKYVYLADALDDLEEDKKSGSYNVLLLREDSAPGGEEESLTQKAVGSLYMTIAEAGKAFELLDTSVFSPILQNIIFLGLKKNTELIDVPKSGRKKRKTR